MKAKEYAAKYFTEGADFSQRDYSWGLLLEDLKKDLQELLDKNKANDNLKGFDNAVNAIRMKFDSIARLSNGLVTEQLWKRFFAQTVAKMREELCPREFTARKQENQRKFEQRQERRAFEDDMEKMITQSHRDYINNAIKTIMCPEKLFEVMGFEGSPFNVTVDQVEEKYQELLEFLPRYQGNYTQEQMLKELNECRDRCIKWITTEDFISTTSAGDFFDKGAEIMLRGI